MSKDKNAGEEYKPYIPADKIMPEFTLTSVVIGVLLAIVFGAANAYLGLKVGMTISASIPAAVISMGIIRGVLKRNSILENNMVQAIGSAGESLAGGVIFTLPALFIWSKQWGLGTPSLFKITLISLFGGILGIVFMVPLRKALIVNEHGKLPYPEGTACSEVLLAGEKGGAGSSTVFVGLGIGALYKFIADGLKLFPTRIETEIKGYKGAMIGGDATPALLGVGFIIGFKISAYMLAGAVLGWLVIIPIIMQVGSLGNITLYPANVPINKLGIWGIWDNYIRYIGAGAVAYGGITSLIKSIPLIVKTFKSAIVGYKDGVGGNSSLRTDTDMPMPVILITIIVIVVLMVVLPYIPVGLGGALLIVVFGFFFATVSSRLVGIVGCSSNPVSGMTIATLLITAAIFKATGVTGRSGMMATLTVGAIICIAVSLAGDTSQDLKTGFLVGATPKWQQYGEMIGVAFSAVVIGGILVLLDQSSGGFGSKELAAPQATLMKLIIEGVMGGNLPWSLVFTGIGIGITIDLLGIPVLPFAVGLYLPIHVSTPIIIGGAIRALIEKSKDKKETKQKLEGGVLYSSGLIAGEGLVGIFIAILCVIKVGDKSIADIIGFGNNGLCEIGTLVFFILLVLGLMKFSFLRKIKPGEVNEEEK